LNNDAKSTPWAACRPTAPQRQPLLADKLFFFFLCILFSRWPSSLHRCISRGGVGCEWRGTNETRRVSECVCVCGHGRKLRFACSQAGPRLTRRRSTKPTPSLQRASRPPRHWPIPRRPLGASRNRLPGTPLKLCVLLSFLSLRPPSCTCGHQASPISRRRYASKRRV